MSPADGSGRRQLLLVAGSGRSGTSLVTGLVARLGFTVPTPEVVADASNPTGFGEPRWAVDFHNQLLRRLQMAPEDGRPEAWEPATGATGLPAFRDRLSQWLGEQLTAADRVVVKDPRLTWFTGLWSAVAEELGCEVSVLTMLRHPAESVRSRELAYGAGSTATTRTAGWLNMMLGVEAATRAARRALVSYDALLTDWRQELRAAEPQLGLSLVSDATGERLTHAGALVDTSLRRAATGWEQLGVPPPVRDLAERVHSELRSLGGQDADLRFDRIDALRAEYGELYAWAAELTRSRVRAARVEERRRAAGVSSGRSTP